VCEELFARIGWCHAARCSIEETDTNPLLKPAHGVAHCGSGQAEPLRCPGKAPFLGNRQECGQDVEIVELHW
jgi:hypothetical protein